MTATARSERAQRKALSRARLRLNDKMFGEDKHGRLAPNFSVQETAVAFFGHSPDWLRWRYRPDQAPKTKPKGWKPKHPKGYFVLDGERLEPKTTQSGARYYTLADIEKMAYALFDNEVFDGDSLLATLQIVYANAFLTGVLAEPVTIEYNPSLNVIKEAAS